MVLQAQTWRVLQRQMWIMLAQVVLALERRRAGEPIYLGGHVVVEWRYWLSDPTELLSVGWGILSTEAARQCDDDKGMIQPMWLQSRWDPCCVSHMKRTANMISVMPERDWHMASLVLHASFSRGGSVEVDHSHLRESLGSKRR